MKQITLSELNRRPGEVVDMALVSPVSLTKRGRQHLVVMSAEHFERLTGRSSAPRKPKLDFSNLQGRE